ncbi:MAG: hypothetical protein OEZ06_21310 [Myxococcales bacterium]|nr:hypothetical protein [Myxococcales bacterium]
MGAKPVARLGFEAWEDFVAFLSQQDAGRGLFMRSRQPLPAGTEIDVDLGFPNGSRLSLAARVIDADCDPRTGDLGLRIQIAHMSAEQAAFLQAAIQRASAAGLRSGGSVRDSRGYQLRFSEVIRLIDASKFSKAEKLLLGMLEDAPEDRGAQIWLLVCRARRHRARFATEDAAAAYREILALDPDHGEACTELDAIADEARQSQEIFQRVFGSTKEP